MAGRPKNSDSTVTRQRILSSAIDLFGRHGVMAVSVRSIGKEAGVTLSTVHHHFGTKDHLFEACIETMYAKLRTHLAELVASFGTGEEPYEMLEAAARSSFRFARQNRPAIQLLLRQVVTDGGLDDDRRDSVAAPYLDIGSQVFGRMAGRDPTELRMPIMNMVYLLARNGASSDDELLLYSGASDIDRALESVEDSLVDIVARVLLD